LTTIRNRTHLNAVAGFIVELFRLNGVVIAEGDRMTRDLGLTSARWQVLGAVELAGRSLSVSQIARNMGLTRQSVQRVANELAIERLVSFNINPDHRRAKLITPTAQGHRAFVTAMQRQARWAVQLLTRSRTSEKRLLEATAVLQQLRLALTETKE
jgi:DNA-binding MarR family transcriptional regulator